VLFSLVQREEYEEKIWLEENENKE